MRIGSTEWCELTNGELRWRDIFSIIASTVVEQARILPEELRAKRGKAPALGSIDVDAITLPDTAVAKDAVERLQTIADPYLVNHSIRTYVWSHILGELDGIAFDSELMYVAALMHDVAFVEPHLGGPGRSPCFTIRSGNEARSVGQAGGWDADKQRRAAECITYHLNLSVPIEAGVEAHLMNRGVLLDVIGARYWNIEKADRQAVVERWPRHQMKKRLGRDFIAQANAHPRTRAGFIKKFMQFEWRVNNAPFDE